MIRLLSFFCFLCLSVSLCSQDIIPLEAIQLMKAYPEQIIAYKENRLIWKDQTKSVFDDAVKKNRLELFENPDIQDQVGNMKYQATFPIVAPDFGSDPGRIRNESFFKKMYGSSEEEVKKNLTRIIWCPNTLQIPLWVSTINEIDKKLVQISVELEKDSSLLPYLSAPGGTFLWRYIAGTKRLSMHSFGITIDINVQYAHYWRWHSNETNEFDQKIIPYKNIIPEKIVKVFEEKGFIWGGRWYHYDTMHFEYRPELLQHQ